MSTFMTALGSVLRGASLHYFNMNGRAVEAHRISVEVYGEHSLAEQTCRKWFARFEAGDFDFDDKEGPGQPKKFEDNDLEALLNEYSCQTLQELSSSLGVDLFTVGKRLKTLGMVQKKGRWIPCELKPGNMNGMKGHGQAFFDVGTAASIGGEKKFMPSNCYLGGTMDPLRQPEVQKVMGGARSTITISDKAKYPGV